jgi:tetratricopeptide (TPR) repeat protein
VFLPEKKTNRERNMPEAENSLCRMPVGRLTIVWRKVVAYSERQWLRCFALVVLGAGVHLPALQGQPIWDDHYLTRGNPMIRSPLLILEAFRHYLFPGSYSGHYRPVQTISYAFDYLVWNTDNYGYHLSNIFWHVASGVTLYFLFQELFRRLGKRWLLADAGAYRNRRRILSNAAFLLALLWVVHPVHSAAVDYISGRADSLAFFFASAGWLLYFKARTISRPWLRRGAYGLAILSALCALCSRESACLWMLVFFIYLFGFDGKLALRAKLAVLTICVALLGVYAGLRQLPETHPDPAAPSGSSPATRAVLMLRALGDYGRLMVFPTSLHMERSVFDPAPLRNRESWRGAVGIEYLSMGGLVLLGAFALGAWRKGVGQKARILGAGWFLLSYLPTSNLFDLNATVAEHWLYLPSVGFLIFLGGVLLDLPKSAWRPAFALACFAVVGLSARSALRSSDWVDPETFYRRTFAAGGSSTRVGVNLAVIYAERGEHAKAEAILRKVLQIQPDHPIARNNLANALFRQGKKEEAEAMFDAASKAAPADRGGYPRTWEAARSLARLRHKEHADAEALAILDRARLDYPGTWELISFEAELLREISGPAGALSIVHEFTREHWWHCGASIALGRIYSEMGEVAKAEEAFRQASWLDVHDAEALDLMALLSVRQNKFEDAVRTQRRAVARQPDQPTQYLLLADILQKMGREEEARQTLEEVSRLESMARPRVVAN